MNITGHSIEQIKDPTGILTGERYEIFLDIEVDEDDELYSENGLRLRVLFYKGDEEERILNYHFQENQTGNVLEFALEETEETYVEGFCRQHLSEVL